MKSDLYVWALEERAEIASDIKWFNAGAKLFSPSGADITGMKLEGLRSRLSSLELALRSPKE